MVVDAMEKSVFGVAIWIAFLRQALYSVGHCFCYGWKVFNGAVRSNMSVTYITCVDEGEFSRTLTHGRKYPIIAVYEETRRVYIQADNGKRAWFPFACFSMEGTAHPKYEEMVIRALTPGPIEHSLQAVIQLPGGEERWCWFATPRMLARHSEWIEGTQNWIHYENAGLILMGTLSEEAAREALHHIHTFGGLETCTLPFDRHDGEYDTREHDSDLGSLLK